MVLVDTSVWISFLNRPGSPEKRVIDGLIDTDEAAIVGVVLAELLQGCRSESERSVLKDLLLALPYIDITQSTWIKAGELSVALRKKGVTLPLSDVVLAAAAIEHSCPVYTLDRHFQKIPGILRYSPV